MFHIVQSLPTMSSCVKQCLSHPVLKHLLGLEKTALMGFYF